VRYLGNGVFQSSSGPNRNFETFFLHLWLGGLCPQGPEGPHLWLATWAPDPPSGYWPAFLSPLEDLDHSWGQISPIYLEVPSLQTLSPGLVQAREESCLVACSAAEPLGEMLQTLQS
jgi:hypothetical protein